MPDYKIPDATLKSFMTQLRKLLLDPKFTEVKIGLKLINY